MRRRTYGLGGSVLAIFFPLLGLAVAAAIIAYAFLALVLGLTALVMFGVPVMLLKAAAEVHRENHREGLAQSKGLQYRKTYGARHRHQGHPQGQQDR